MPLSFLSLFGLVALLLATPSHGVPPHLDVDQAKQKLLLAQSQVDAALTEVNRQEARVEDSRRILRNDERLLNNALSKLSSLQYSLEQLDSNLASFEKRLPVIDELQQSLKTKMQESVAALGQLKRRYERIESQLSPLKVQLTQTQRKISEIQLQINQKIPRLETLQKQLKEKNQEISSLNGIIERLTRSIPLLEKEKQDLLTSLTGLQTQGENLKSKLGELNSAAGALNKKIQNNQDQKSKASLALEEEQKKPKPNPAVIKRIKERLNQLTGVEKNLLAQKRRIQTEIQSTRLQIAQNQENLKSVKNKIKVTENRISNQKEKLSSNKLLKNTAVSQANQINQSISSVQAELRPLRMALRQLQNQESQLLSEVTQKQNRLDQVSTNIRQTQQEIAQIKIEREKLQAEKTNLGNQIAQLKRDRPRLLSQIKTTRLDIKNGEEAVSVSKQAVRNALFELKRLRSDLQLARQNLEDAQFHYQTVLANYEREKNRILDFAQTQGAQDGSVDAAFAASGEGAQAGKRRAEILGTNQGTQHAQQRDYALGYQKGRKEGPLTPDLKPSYQQGLLEGKQQSHLHAKAVSFPEGYNYALTHLLQQSPENEVVVDMAAQMTDSSAPVGQPLDLEGKPLGSFEPPSYDMIIPPDYALPSVSIPSFSVPAPSQASYSPPCATLLLPEVAPLCRQVYLDTYHSTFNQHYQQQYRASFVTAFENHIAQAYQSGLNQQFGEQKLEGTRRGVLDKGVLDGYGGSLEDEKTQAYQQGQKALQEDKEKGYLVREHRSLLVDSNGDDLFTPGETLHLQVELENLGDLSAPQGQLRVRILKTTGFQTPDVGERSFPLLQGNSKTILQNVLPLTVRDLPAGANLNFEGVIEMKSAAGTYKVLKQIKGNYQAHFSLELEAITLSQTPKVGEKVMTTFRFKNLTSRTFPEGSVKLLSSPNMVSFEDKLVELPQLEQNEVVEVEVPMTPGIWVGGNTPVRFVSTPMFQKEEGMQEGQIQTFSQPFYKTIPINRSASLYVFQKGKALDKGEIQVQAGSVVHFQVQFTFHATRPLPGPFKFRASKFSHPEIKAASHSTVGVDYGAWSPTSSSSPVNMAYQIPQSLKGKPAWIMVSLYEGAQIIHAQMIYLNVL